MKQMTEKDLNYLGAVLHDQSVVRFFLEGKTIYFDAECYNDERQIYEPISIMFENISDLEINKASASSLNSHCEDGEILRLQATNDNVLLIIQWNNFKDKINIIDIYRFKCTAIAAQDDRSEKQDNDLHAT